MSPEEDTGRPFKVQTKEQKLINSTKASIKLAGAG